MLTAVAHAEIIPLENSQLRFTYQTFDKRVYLNCTSQVENAKSYDWRVNCVDSKIRLKKDFRVHLMATRYPHASPPLVTYELLYWVTDLSLPGFPSSGSSSWYHLKQMSDLDSLTVRQSVDGDSAGLYLDIATMTR